MSVHAIILAAGYGTRLRPITEWIPKPLMPIGPEPLLRVIAHDLVSAGVSQLAVNTHHLPKAIDEYVSTDLRDLPIALYHEPEILGTGGPLVNAKELLSDAECFVLYNGDILSDIDLKALIDCHVSGEQLVTMALIDGPENKLDVEVKDDGTATVVDILDKLKRGKENHRRMTYSGISVYSPEIFQYLPSKPEFCSIITAILSMMEEQPTAVSGYIQEEMYWNDLGTVEKFLDTNNELKQGHIPFVLRGDTTMESAVSRLAEQGSAREFYRIRSGNDHRVLMRSSADDPDFDRFIEFGNLFSDLDLPTPMLYGYNPDNYCVLMEYLGDTTLNSWVASCSSQSDVEHKYRQVIDELVRYQSIATQGLEARPEIVVREFDYDYLRWETDYFRENYLQAIKGMAAADTDILEKEFHRLAEDARAMPYMFLHRDFQSQNIMVTDNQIRFVDFQGGRLGPLTYDVMSLVNDPYVDLEKDMRQRLLSYYLTQLDARTGVVSGDSDEWLRTAGLQRLMQALGAFGFLGLRKGKRGYLDHIPRAEAYLIELLAEDGRLPTLRAIMTDRK